MELARCILLFLQFFLHLFYTYIDITSSFLKPILLMFPSTCPLHFIFSQACLYFPSTSCTIVILKTSSSGCHKTQLYLTAFALATLFAAFSISSSVFLLSTNFKWHITLTIDLSALPKILTSSSLKPIGAR